MLEKRNGRIVEGVNEDKWKEFVEDYKGIE
jgi:hypothetical protein